MKEIVTLSRFGTLAKNFSDQCDLRGYQALAEELKAQFPNLHVKYNTEDDLRIEGKGVGGVEAIFELTVYGRRIQVRSWKVGKTGPLGRIHDTFIHHDQDERRHKELYHLFKEVLRYTY